MVKSGLGDSARPSDLGNGGQSADSKAKSKAMWTACLYCSALLPLPLSSPALHLKPQNTLVLDFFQLLAQALALEPNEKLHNSASKNKISK